jgi:NAD(P)-dependent dehydrogenase (short-subunit alcohol dehydrogenase family)
MDGLSGKVAIVTGAGRGEGAATAQALAAAGVRVAVNDINPDRAERTAAAIRRAGGQAVGLMADVSNKFQAASLIESTRAEWGRLDIVINYAAVRPTIPLLTMDEWDWVRCLDVNLKGAFFMMQLCGRVMADENQMDEGGIIINVGPKPADERPQAAYAASKAGLLALTAAAARELAPVNIRVLWVEYGADCLALLDAY